MNQIIIIPVGIIQQKKFCKPKKNLVSGERMEVHEQLGRVEHGHHELGISLGRCFRRCSPESQSR